MSANKQLSQTEKAKTSTSTTDITWSYKSTTRQYVYETFGTKAKLGKFQVAIILLLDGINRELSRSHLSIAFGKRLKFETEKAKIQSIVSTLKRMVSLGYIDGYLATHLRYSPMMFKANAQTHALANAIKEDISNLRFSGFGMGNLDLRNPDAIMEDARKNLASVPDYERKEDE